MRPIKSYVGLDAHKSTISIAVTDEGRRGEVRHHGVVENRADIVIKLAARLGRRGERLHFCYEAGPCGYGLHRLLSGIILVTQPPCAQPPSRAAVRARPILTAGSYL